MVFAPPIWHHWPRSVRLLWRPRFVPPGVAGASQSSVLLGLHGVRTPEDPPLKPPAALKLLKEGNLRFAKGAPEAGKIDAQMRKALADVGQAPHTAVLGCADSRVPLELVFDTLPGDLFVLRNAGNTCVHSEGSVLGSLEFCIGALNTKLILILGHTNCGAIKGATKQTTHMCSACFPVGNETQEPANALGALLMGLSDVAQEAEAQLGSTATEAQLADESVKLNVFKSMDYLLDNSRVIGSKVLSGEVDLEGGIYDLDTGRVTWLGKSSYVQRRLRGAIVERNDVGLQQLWYLWEDFYGKTGDTSVDIDGDASRPFPAISGGAFLRGRWSSDDRAAGDPSAVLTDSGSPDVALLCGSAGECLALAAQEARKGLRCKEVLIKDVRHLVAAAYISTPSTLVSGIEEEALPAKLSGNFTSCCHSFFVARNAPGGSSDPSSRIRR
eukprot:g28654.t1